MKHRWIAAKRLGAVRKPLAAAAICLFATACSSADFEAVSKISKPRLLNLIQLPPDVAPSEQMIVNATVAVPPNDATTLHYEWSLCLFDEGPNGYYRCAEDVPDLPVANVLAESTDAQFVFTQDQLSNEHLHTACELLKQAAENMNLPPQIAASLPRCITGLPARLRVKVCADQPGCTDAEAQIASTKIQLLFDEHRNRTDRNVNPQMAGLRLDGQTLPMASALEVRVEQAEQEFLFEVDASSAQSAQTFFPISAETGEAEEEPQREELQTDWYASAGKMKGARRYYREGITPDDEFTINAITFKIDEIEDGQEVDLWVTLRDSRGGNATISRRIVLRK